MIRVANELKTQLRRQPEYGMGYQAGKVSLSSGGVETGYIINGELFVSEAEFAQLNSDIFAKLATGILIERSHLVAVSALLVSRPSNTLRGVRLVSRANGFRGLIVCNSSIPGPAKDAPITQTISDEVFIRFSAFSNDFRVTERRGLAPYTFATTAEDATLVRTGMDAVARYALKNKTPANNVFTIRPPACSNMQRGIVEPAYGEEGGGVEVIFVDGSPDNTVSGPATIQEK